MNKKALASLPIIGFLAGLVGVVFFAKNKNVQEAVKKGSVSLLNETKVLMSKLQDKLGEVQKTNPGRALDIISKGVDDITARLEKTDKDSIEGALDNAANKINEVLENLEKTKEEKVDPAVKSAVDSLKELKEKLIKK